MATTLRKPIFNAVLNEIETHVAWRGLMSGLQAEKMLRGQTTPFLYILRKGETETESETDYYVTFVLADLSIRHQPFVITIAEDGWFWENHGTGGPYTDAVSIDDVLHLMMHCPQGANSPFMG